MDTLFCCNLERAGDLLLPVRENEEEKQSSSKAVEAMVIMRSTLKQDGPRDTDKTSTDGT